MDNRSIKEEPFSNIKRAPNVDFPFRNIQDENGLNLNVIALGAPFRKRRPQKIIYKISRNGIPNNRCH